MEMKINKKSGLNDKEMKQVFLLVGLTNLQQLLHIQQRVDDLIEIRTR